MPSRRFARASARRWLLGSGLRLGNSGRVRVTVCARAYWPGRLAIKYVAGQASRRGGRHDGPPRTRRGG